MQKRQALGECRDVSPEEAESIILGYTAGNDLTCRFFQLRENSGGQFFYAKAFDKFAPIGPVLTSADDFAKGERIKLITRVNGQVVQNADLKEDMISSPAKILSFMSQGTTIPAFTAVMTGTPKGVGYFRKPKQPLNHEDIVEVEITNIGVLKNRILFPEGK
ncbi:hypothetical protein EYZ11_004312 [Aspergillus tanneri]|uniref:Fumarylacetoacetase-like C-terminal domain-containing protein n=1 Tax=Aspergillus tanneri TaxID=1220188 RepID=A0A4V3UPR7_9EURO|nr:hypothetical protein EYZ11_004312 [Aspergillus tanneri]